MAAQLIVLFFEGAGTASGVLDALKELEASKVIELEDAVVASRGATSQVIFTQVGEAGTFGTPTERTPEVEIEQTDSRRGRYALAGGGIGLLAGWLIGGPVGGLAVGAVIGALRDRGIDDKFIKETSERLRPDTSAIFLLGRAADQEKVLEALRPFNPQLVKTTLPPETEQALRAALASKE
jgi:uncharacterized membrane protein